jgi:hypothetical protein
MPLLYVLVKVIEITFVYRDTLTTANIVAWFLVSALGIFLLYLVAFYSIRFFTLNVPTDLISWSAPLSKLPYANMGIKAFLVLSCALDSSGQYGVYEVVIIFVI